MHVLTEPLGPRSKGHRHWVVGGAGALIVLALAIDYSLLMVSRWREERTHGRSNDEADRRAIETAGRRDTALEDRAR
jgi:uncharacterized membrane protein YdfJ with MMPL/SSD domain